MDKTLLSLGHGYSAQALAKLLLPQDWRITGTTRSPEKLADIAATGVKPLLWSRSDVAQQLTNVSNILISAGPTATGDPVLGQLNTELRRNAKRFRWVGYLSTTGVYGDHQGAWVDETTPLAPATQRGQARVIAEAEWTSIPNLPLHIFRLAGIYGPGRGPFTKVRRGTARRIIKEGQVFSRIHVEDIASALELSLRAPSPGAIFNLCDDDPAPPQDVIAHAAELLEMTLPPAIRFEDADLTPMPRSFYEENKKVRNDRAKQALGWAPKYADYRAGLAALLALERVPVADVRRYHPR